MNATMQQRNEALLQIRAAIAADRDAILAANEQDLEEGRNNGLEAALLDRLAITPAQLDVLQEGLSQVAALSDPIGHVSDMQRMPSGIDVGTWYANHITHRGIATHKKSTVASIFTCLSLRAGVFLCVIVHAVCIQSTASPRHIEAVQPTGREHKYTVTKLIHC